MIVEKRGLGTLHSVSVWASEFGLLAGSSGSAPEIERDHGHPRTPEAGGHQRGNHHDRRDGDPGKEIAAQIIEGGADYVLALKGNQETLIKRSSIISDERAEGGLD